MVIAELSTEVRKHIVESETVLVRDFLWRIANVEAGVTHDEVENDS
jgi:hypothetical protein